ncbi:ABC transporter permease [Paenibacillus daejeonensis]|uniref:ABC transporter permease n=1 Tax=Paenibacillus daejeonensis TaxID=135193 RepID=UPI000368244F|nr:ABC transporter permease [Paenibacillus daejeonensis]
MRRSALYWTLHDSGMMTIRSIRHMLRSPESLLLSVGLPVMLMLLFVYVFGGAIQTGGEYINYIVPGVIVTCVGYGSSMTAMSVALDMNGGLFDRLRSMPARPAALLGGHVLGTYVKSLLGTLLVFLCAIAIGFRPSATLLDWLGIFAILSLFLLAISWLAVVFGLVAGSAETASAFSFFIMFLPYVSSAFVPTETMPSWLHAFAAHQPMTPLIETLRGLLIGTPIGNQAVWAVVWFGGMLLLSATVASILFHRRRKV